MWHTSREAESCFHRPLALSTPGGKKRTEHDPKFSNGVQDDCQHLQTAWKSSWAGYNGGTSGNHHNPGGEASLSVHSQIRTASQRGERRERNLGKEEYREMKRRALFAAKSKDPKFPVIF